MQTEETRTDLGTIKMHKHVVASIASLSSLEVEGVKRVGGDIKTAIYDLFGKKGLGGINVEFDKNEEVHVEIPLIIKYNFNIPEVVTKVQDNVHRALEKMTNLVIKDIDIKVLAVER